MCQGKAEGTLSPQTASTKLARIAIKSACGSLRPDGQQQSCRLRLVSCRFFGPKGPLLTNHMTELVTYGSVGGVGGNSGPYPAAADVSARRGSHPMPKRTRRNAELLLSGSRVNHSFSRAAEFFGSTGERLAFIGNYQVLSEITSATGRHGFSAASFPSR